MSAGFGFRTARCALMGHFCLACTRALDTERACLKACSCRQTPRQIKHLRAKPHAAIIGPVRPIPPPRKACGVASCCSWRAHLGDGQADPVTPLEQISHADLAKSPRKMKNLHLGFALFAAIWLGGCSTAPIIDRSPAPSAPAEALPQPDPKPEVVMVKVRASETAGRDVDMPVHVFLPPSGTSSAPRAGWPAVIFSHGRAADASSRMQLQSPVLPGHVRYWHAKGYAVIAPIRPGYGANYRDDPENSGASWRNGMCVGQADFAKTAAAATHAVKSAHAWLMAQPWADKSRILLAGQSVGGLTTVAACGQNWPGVLGCVNFSGGAGGNPTSSPGQSCQPDRIGELMAQAARTTRVPSIWLYAANDLYWGEEAPKRWHQAHAEAALAAGQTQTADFFASPAVAPDGHRLLRSGGHLWSPTLGAWLKKHGF